MQATLWIDSLGLEYEGEYIPYRAATRTDPAEGGNVEDLAVVGIRIETISHRSPDGDVTRQIINLLDGCDLGSPDIKRLLSNLTEAFAVELQEAAIEDAAE